MLIKIPESEIITPTGEVNTRLNGRIAAQFINKSNSELTGKNYLSNLRQFMLFSGKRASAQMLVEDVLAWRVYGESRTCAARDCDEAGDLERFVRVFQGLRHYQS